MPCFPTAAFVLRGIDDVVFEERPVPDASKLGPDQWVVYLHIPIASELMTRSPRVLVAPKATGICGSDVHYLKHGTALFSATVPRKRILVKADKASDAQDALPIL